MKKPKVIYLTQASLVAAMYIVLTHLSNLVGLANGAVQLRLSEALCVLPFFMPAAAIGLFVGCFISNLTTGAVIIDVILGSIATLIGGLIASKIKNKWLVPLPTVISNAVIVPFVILYCYTEVINPQTYLITFAGVLAGEVISAYIFGTVLLLALEKKKGIFSIKRK